MAVTLQSLEQNADTSFHYDIKIMNADNISVENKFKILAEFEKDGFDIEFVDVTPFIETMSSKLHTRDYYSKSTYYRLLIPNISRLNSELFYALLRMRFLKLFYLKSYKNLICIY